MKRRAQYKVVAEACKVQYHEVGDKLFLVFEITDEKFKQEVRKDWIKDIELEIIEKKNLIKFEEK